MEYKRLEIYVGWTCNQKCTYCMEFPNMEKAWNIKVSKLDILKKLLKFKRSGFNHVTYLGGEPFIQPVFHDALLLGKKFGYTILVTTNATMLHLDKIAKRFLPHIDELILSAEAIDKETQRKISRTNGYVEWEKVFENIGKYWNGTMLKANIVVTRDNLSSLQDLVRFLSGKGCRNIAITYPDIDYEYYGRESVRTRIAPRYSECMEEILPIIDFCGKNGILLKLPDFPFCVFPEDRESYIALTDDYDYANRIKITYDEKVLDREEFLPRKRKHVEKCDGCRHSGMCWGPSVHYDTLYGLSEIRPWKEKIPKN